MALYAQGFSVSNYLVNKSSRPEFLNFIADGMRRGWDTALQQHYQIRSVDDLEQEWLAQLRATKRGQQTLLASNTTPANVDPANRVVVRQTAPPAQPFDDSPRNIYRGVAPEGSEWQQSGRPTHLPEFPQPGRPSRDGWQASPERHGPPQVQLLAPQFDAAPPPAARLGQPVPGPASPVGYPR
jgi:hypothetical protein